jgi:hypothetical protein
VFCTDGSFFSTSINVREACAVISSLVYEAIDIGRSIGSFEPSAPTFTSGTE